MAALEFAMLAPVFLIVLFLIVQFGFKYYLVSIVHAATFDLSQAIVDAGTRPADLGTAKQIFSAKLLANSGMVAASRYTLYVGQVSATAPTATPPTADYFSINPQSPTLVRVIYPAMQLVDMSGLVAAWPALFSQNLDVSIVVVPR